MIDCMVDKTKRECAVRDAKTICEGVLRYLPRVPGIPTCDSLVCRNLL